jgi:Tfp pilus assembly protein PilO
MTFNQDFEQNSASDFLEEAPNYPVAFGITFTPQLSGLALGLLGLAGAGYILLNFVLPAYDSFQTLKAEEATKQEKVDAKKLEALNQQFAEAQDRLQQSELLRSQVLDQFTSPQNLQTLLYDIFQRAKARGVTLNSYTPQGDLTVVNDDSLGNAVNNKLKRQIFTLAIEGGYPQIYAFIGDLEKLQPLLIVSALKMNFDQSSFPANGGTLKSAKGTIASPGKTIPNPGETIKASFNLEAIVPLSPAELANLSQSKEKDQNKDKAKQSPKASQSPPPNNGQPPEKK